MTSSVSPVIQSGYLLATGLFILGLHYLRSPASVRRGNAMAALGMLIAIGVTLADHSIHSYGLLTGGLLLGSLAGTVAARRVPMTAMPQMVGLFNGFGGAASTLVATGEFFRLSSSPSGLTPETIVMTVFGVLIGSITFTGSMIAFGKLQSLVPEQPLTFPWQHPAHGVLLLACLVGGVVLLTVSTDHMIFLVLLGLALLLGGLFVLPIGAADMPVVISFLNSCSGLAASAAGFVVQNALLITAGALVGASGLILTQIMCKAMNRSLPRVLFGSLRVSGPGVPGTTPAQGGMIHAIDAEEGAMMLAYAQTVVLVPGYGMAVAQAQHAVFSLAELLKQRGVIVKYAIHPVAGRMPGHMNVLLAEANVPYTELIDMEDINPEFCRTDVALIIGANDIVNPAARSDPQSPIYGMPILDVDKAHHVVIIKRSLKPGFAGIENALFSSPKTLMLFGDAREMATNLVNEIKQL
jgi:NAD(P) transhydrogenase subunit beta